MVIDNVLLQVLNRKYSLFEKDMKAQESFLQSEISGKNILIIGGAGTIGYSFIKAALDFKPKKVVIIDTNENGLTELIRTLRSMPRQFIPDEFITYPVSFDSPVFEKLL